MWVCVYLILALTLTTLFLGGFDASIHTSEEALDAPSAVPFAILSSIALVCVLGLGEGGCAFCVPCISHGDVPAVVICLAFNMGTDLVALLSSPIDQPMAVVSSRSKCFPGRSLIEIWQILANSLGTGGTITFWVFVAILL